MSGGASEQFGVVASERLGVVASERLGVVASERLGVVESRLAGLGLRIPAVVPPVAAYVPAVLDGHYVFTSGQLPMVAGQMAGTGQVGTGAGWVSPEDAKMMAQVCALNALAAVKSVIGDLDRVTRVVKVVGYVASAPGFTGQPGVVNGASELLGQAFGAAGRHARSAVGVAALPLGAPVEVELIVSVAPGAVAPGAVAPGAVAPGAEAAGAVAAQGPA